MSTPTQNCASTYLVLKPDAHAIPIPVTASFWPDLMQGKFGNFHNEYLVTLQSYDAKWPSWEIHPHGDEIICLISGSIDLTLDHNGTVSTVSLRKPGDFALVKQGTWHTATPLLPTSMLFITAGEGTQNRPAN
jgi:mannose-6-phosphate isomerase-like protein (cupin superfamily)